MNFEMKLIVKTKEMVSKEDVEMIQSNILALVNEVRPDLVSENVDVEILCIEVEN